MSDHKERVNSAMNRYIEKQLGKGTTREPSRKNKTPERDTEKSVLKWGRLNGFHLHVVEASSYDRVTGRMGQAKAEAGFPDVVGNTSNGLGCYIELKAKDRRSKLSDSQRVFLKNKIAQNCFAVVVDSSEKLQQYWKGFCSLKTPTERQHYLIDCLPKQVPNRGRKRDVDPFEEKHGF